MFVPIDKKLTNVVGELGFVNTPLPETTDQTPVPTVGVLAAIVAVKVLHTVIVVPAFAMVGKLSR